MWFGCVRVGRDGCGGVGVVLVVVVCSVVCDGDVGVCV